MNEYKWTKRDFSEIDERVETFNREKDPDVIDNLNRRIDLDYISNSDKIEGIDTVEALSDIIKNPKLKVLKSYPFLVVEDKNLPSGKFSSSIINVYGLDKEEKEELLNKYLKETELVIFDTETNEEFNVKTTGHLRAVMEVMEAAKTARKAKEKGEEAPLTDIAISDNVNCHILGEPFGRYRSPYFYQIVGLKDVDWCIPGGHRVDGEMQKLLDWYNNGSKDLHPIERAAIFHIEFIRIHPFPDGNGRTGRLLLNYELVKNGFPTITIKASQRGEYVDAINEGIMKGDATKMIDLIHGRLESRLNLYNSILDAEV